MMEMYALFGPEGPFARAFDGYEVRPPQQQMAERVRHLCEEAPSGWRTSPGLQEDFWQQEASPQEPIL